MLENTTNPIQINALINKKEEEKNLKTIRNNIVIKKIETYTVKHVNKGNIPQHKEVANDFCWNIES